MEENDRTDESSDGALKPQSESPDSTDQDAFRILSHQLKSPIDTIQSLLKTISDGFTGEINPQALHLIERAVSRAEEAKEMISDLLDYELLSRRKEAVKEEFDLVLLLNTLVMRYASIASEKEIYLSADLPLKHRIIVLGDSRSLEQAIRNIIENAVQYTPAQGSINILFSFSEADKRCQIQIKDTGYGISEDELESIFDPFYRSIKHKSSVPGTGLGLPIARRVIAGHNGSLTVESKENEGTTFRIVLPFISLKISKQDIAERKKVVIIGGVTAGPKAAARLRRLDEELDITIIEKSQFLSYSGCGLPSYISGKVSSPKALMSTADNTIRDVHFFESIKNIKILNNTLALDIDRKKKTVKTQDSSSGSIAYLNYDVLVLATGAVPLVPEIPGIRQAGVYSLYSLEDAEAIKKEISEINPQDVYIIGGGLIGVSTAESLIDTGARVTILEKQDCILQNLMDTDIALKIQNVLNRKGIKIITGANMVEIRKRRKGLTIITKTDEFTADLIILSTGVKPNIVLAERASLEIGEAGGIKVNEYLKTSDENIYAVGDCAESVNIVTKKHEYWPLGSISTKMGRIAADNICGRKSIFKGSNGTAMFKIIDTNVARTGLTLETAHKVGFDAESVTVTGLDKAHYYVNAQYLILKIIVDKKTKVILGAQGLGRGDVTAKIGILSCAITQSLSLDDVFKLDLGYAPAFNNPIDIVQTACLVLHNKIDNLLRTITLREFELEKDKVNIIDVSPHSEHSLSSIPGSINIPLENIRLEDIPYDKKAKVILYSKTSSGAYKAYKYLVTRGYSNLYVLEGGYVYWQS